MQGYSSGRNGSLGENSLSGRGNLAYHENYPNPNGYNPNQGTGRAREGRMDGNSNYSRRTPQLTPYKLKCDHEPINARLGIPDFFPHTENVEEEVLNRENIQNGYRETVSGIEDGKDNSLILTLTLHSASRIWDKKNVMRYREAAKKQFHSLSTALSRKRKAGQIYGVPLDGNLVSKFGNFSEQKNFGEEFRRKWMQDLSGRKKLCILSESVPHGFRKKSLFESLLRHNVPFLRATWFIKTMFLNQIRPSSMHARSDKSLTTRTDTWTNDVLDFAKSLLDELSLSDAWQSPYLDPNGENTIQNPNLTENQPEEMDINSKWNYLLRLILWNISENILSKTLLVDWIFKQIMEKESINIIEALFPILREMKNFISLSQSYTRQCMEILFRTINFLTPVFFSHVVQSTKQSFPFKTYILDEGMALEEEKKSTRNVNLANNIISFLYSLFLSLPDAFISYEYTPLLSSFFPEIPLLQKKKKREENEEKDEEYEAAVDEIKENESVDASVIENSDGREHDDSITGNKSANLMKEKFEKKHAMKIKEYIHDLKLKSDLLSSSANPSFLNCNETKLVLILDQSLNFLDVDSVCNSFFGSERIYLDSEKLGKSEKLFFSTKSNVSEKSFLSVKTLCDWAIFGFLYKSDANEPSKNRNDSVDDLSTIYFAVSVLKTQKRKWMDGRKSRNKRNEPFDEGNKEPTMKLAGKGNCSYIKSLSSKKRRENTSMDARESNMIHDLIVQWVNHSDFSSKKCQHRLKVFLGELVKQNIFNPYQYLKSLISDGMLEDEFSSLTNSHSGLLSYSPYLPYSCTISSSPTLRSSQHRVFLACLPCPPHLELLLEPSPLIPEKFFSSLDTVSSESQSELLKEEARQYECEKHFALHRTTYKKRKRADRMENSYVHSSFLFHGYYNDIGLKDTKNTNEEENEKCSGLGSNIKYRNINSMNNKNKLTMTIDSILFLLRFPHTSAFKIDDGYSVILLDGTKVEQEMDGAIQFKQEDKRMGSENKNNKSDGKKLDEGRDEDELWWVKKPKLEKLVDSQPFSHGSMAHPPLKSHSTQNSKEVKSELKNGFTSDTKTIYQQSFSNHVFQDSKLQLTESASFARRSLNRSDSVSGMKTQNLQNSQPFLQNCSSKSMLDVHRQICALKSSDKRRLSHWINQFVHTIIILENKTKKEVKDDTDENRTVKMADLNKLHSVEEKTVHLTSSQKKQTQSKIQSSSKNDNGVASLDSVKTGNRARSRTNKNNKNSDVMLLNKEKENKGDESRTSHLPNKPLLSWKLDDEKLQWMICFLDLISDYQTLMDILVCLLPFSSSTVHFQGEMTGKNHTKDKTIDSNFGRRSLFDLSEAFLISCFQRYEKFFIVTANLPRLLSSISQKTMNDILEGKNHSFPSLFYLKSFLSRHGTLSAVKIWQRDYKEKNGIRIFNELDNVKVDEKGECSWIKDKNSLPFSPHSPSQTKKNTKEGKDKKSKNTSEDENGKLKLIESIFRECIDSEVDEIIEVERLLALKDKKLSSMRSNFLHPMLRRSNSVSDNINLAIKELEWGIKMDICMEKAAMRLASLLRQYLSVNSSRSESHKQDEFLISKCVGSMLSSLAIHVKRIVDSFAKFSSGFDSSLENIMFDLPEHFDFDSNTNFDTSLFDLGDFEIEKEREKGVPDPSARKYDQDVRKTNALNDNSEFIIRKKSLRKHMQNPRFVMCCRTLLASYTKCYRLLKECLGRHYDRAFDTCLLAEVTMRLRNSNVSIPLTHMSKKYFRLFSFSSSKSRKPDDVNDRDFLFTEDLPGDPQIHSNIKTDPDSSGTSCLVMEMDMDIHAGKSCGYGNERGFAEKGSLHVDEDNDMMDDAEMETDINVITSIAFLFDSATKGNFSLLFLIDNLRLKEAVLDIGKVLNSAENDYDDNEKNDRTNRLETHLVWIYLLLGDFLNLRDGFLSVLLNSHTCFSLKRMQQNIAVEEVFPVVFPLFSSIVDACLKDEVLRTMLINRLNGDQCGLGVKTEENDWLNRVRGGYDGEMNFNSPGTERKEKIINISVALLDELFGNPTLRSLFLQNSRIFLLHSQKSNDHANLKSSSTLLPSFPSSSFLCRLFLDCFLQEKLDIQELEEESKSNEIKRMNGEIEFKGGIGLGRKEDMIKKAQLIKDAKNERLVKKIWCVLSTMNSLHFRYQSVQIRLLLDEQNHLDNERSNPNQLSECEKNFVSLLISSIVYFPHSSLLFSQLISFLGKNMENWLLIQIKWILEGSAILFGHKSLRTYLRRLAQKNFYSPSNPTSDQRPVGIQSQIFERPMQQKTNAAYHDLFYPEEKDKVNVKMEKHEEAKSDYPSCDEELLSIKGSKNNSSTSSGFPPFYAERAIAELALPCLSHASDELRSSFMADLIKQFGNLEKHLSSSQSQTSSVDAAVHGKGLKNGRSSILSHDTTFLSANLGHSTSITFSSHNEGDERRLSNRKDEAPASNSSHVFAIRNSLWLRLQFLIPLFPILFSDRDLSSKNMRQTLAVIFLRLLSSAAIHSPPASTSYSSPSSTLPSQPPDPDERSFSEISDSFASNLAGDDLFDRILLLLHSLMHPTCPGWLSPLSSTRSPRNQRENISAFDKEQVDRMQTELDSFRLEPSLHQRIRFALPCLPCNQMISFSATTIPPHEAFSGRSNEKRVLGKDLSSAKSPFLPSPSSANKGQTSTSTLPKHVAANDSLSELDPWLFLEEGATGSASNSNSTNSNFNSNSNPNLSSGFLYPSSNASSENVNMKASHLLKGCVRVFKTSLSYSAALEKESEENEDEEDEQDEQDEEDDYENNETI